MNLKTATLIKRSTDDGAFTLNDDVELGKKYIVDADTIVTAEGYNVEKNMHWKHDMIAILMEKDKVMQISSPQPFPIELLEIEGIVKR